MTRVIIFVVDQPFAHGQDAEHHPTHYQTEKARKAKTAAALTRDTSAIVDRYL